MHLKSLSEYMLVLQDQVQFETLTKDDKVHIFVFSADWCPDCIYLRTFMEEIVTKWKQYCFVYVNRDDWMDLCEEINVVGIPSFVAYHKGNECGRLVSTLRKSKAEIETFLGGIS